MKYTNNWLQRPTVCICRFFGTLLAIFTATHLSFWAILRILHQPVPSAVLSTYLGEVVLAVCIVAALAMMRRFGDRDIPWRNWFAPHRAMRNTCVGLIIMAVSGLLQAWLLWHYDLIIIVNIHRPAQLWLDPSYMAIVAFAEETIFRGYVFRKIEASAGSTRALFTSSVLFGVVHLINPGLPTVYDKQQMTLSAFIGGMLYGAAYLLSRSLWLPMALHFMQDYYNNVLFGPSDFGHEWLVTAFRAGIGLNSQYWLQQVSDIAITVAFLLLIARREWHRLETASSNDTGSTPPHTLPSGQQ